MRHSHASRAPRSLQIAVLALVALSGAVPHALAQPETQGMTSEETPEQREQNLLRAGYELRKAGQDREAFEKFREAYSLRRDTKSLAQMALAALALDDWAGAYSMLQQALDDPEHPWIRANRSLLETELQRIAMHLGRLNLEIEPVGATVVVDGTLIGTAPLEHPLVLGPRVATVEVTHPGYVTYRQTVQLAPGQQQRGVIHLRRENVVTPQARPEAPTQQTVAAEPAKRSWFADRNPLWLGGAIAGVAVSLSATIPWAIANRRVGDLEGACRSDENCDFSGVSKSVQQLDVLTNTLLLSGIGVTAVSSVLYLTLPKSPPGSEQRLTGWMSRTSAGVEYRRAF